MYLVFSVAALLSLSILAIIVINNRTPAQLGVTNGSLAHLPKTPNAVSSQTSDIDKKVDPLPFNENLAQSKNSLKLVLSELDDIDIIDESKNYMHVVSTSKTMRFHDDIEFFFDERSKVVHFRSASRVGFSDMNVNRKRYERLRQEYMDQF